MTEAVAPGGSLLLRNATVLDPATGEYAETDLRIADGVVADGNDDVPGAGELRTIDVAGAYVLPGLVDCHVHVRAASADLAELRFWPASYQAFQTARLMGDMLDRGFTTVRDTGGADFGIAQAQREGLLRGPRLLYGGHGLSQTGGHSDDRGPGDDTHVECGCASGMGRIVDGVDEMRRAVRDEIRKGADHIKVMASGGVASPTDRIDSVQFSVDELRAAVEEATSANRYVAAHAYTPAAINRALEAGVRTIEHANLLDDSCLELFKAKHAYVVMNLVTYWALQTEGREQGLPEVSWRKVSAVLDGGKVALEKAAAAGVPIGYGTDLLGGMQRHQSHEFVIRRELQPAIDVIRSATTVAAEIVQREGLIGTLSPGAYGDAVVLDADPTEDIGVLADPARLRHVVQNGLVVGGHEHA